MRNAKALAAAVCATLSLSAGSAFAVGDIQVVNSGGQLIHPYFKSNCWNSSVSSAGAGDWVFFGGIDAGSTFTWDQFFLLLDPKCRNPIVKFTYAMPGEPAPNETVVPRTVVLHYDAIENVRIVLGNEVVVKDVSSY